MPVGLQPMTRHPEDNKAVPIKSHSGPRPPFAFTSAVATMLTVPPNKAWVKL